MSDVEGEGQTWNGLNLIGSVHLMKVSIMKEGGGGGKLTQDREWSVKEDRTRVEGSISIDWIG